MISCKFHALCIEIIDALSLIDRILMSNALSIYGKISLIVLYLVYYYTKDLTSNIL